MLDGRVMRIDHKRDCVYVVRRGRTYEAPMSEVETKARVPSARVLFNIRRDKGVERAENVTLRSGTRTNKRQRRFGDLTGARQPGSKVATTAQNRFGIDVTTQPFRVAREWVGAIGSQDFDGATSLYLPGAVVHTADRDVIGRLKIRSLLEQTDWVGIGNKEVDLRGVDRYVRANSADGEAILPTYFEIDNGQISEQWLGVEPEVEYESEDPSYDVVVKGHVPEDAVDYARKKMEALIGEGSSAQIKLTLANNPAVVRLAMAEGRLTQDGRTVRAHTAAESMNEAIDLVVGRLRNSLRNHHKHDPATLRRNTGTWRHGDRPSTEYPYFDRPEPEREIVRHKSFAPDEMTIDEAAWDMSQLDYDFFLFVEMTTGMDCLLEATPEGSLVLHGLASDSGVTSEVVEFEFGVVDPTRLKPSEAIRFMENGGTRFVFFENTETNQRNVLYRRYDGHYGLITPPAE